jgi:phosphatidylglycerophosphate synthase
MLDLWEWIKSTYLRLIEPLIGLLIRWQVSPNTITTVGTFFACASGVIFGTGHIKTAGWLLSITAVFDLADGIVARRTNRTTTFGAFWDSTLDRIADGFLLGGLTFFFASSSLHRSMPMVAVGLLGLIATFVTSYARSRAETLGIEMKGVGMMERAERIVLLAVPQAFFGLALDGLVLRLILSLLSATAIVTVVQRMYHVHSATRPAEPPPAPATDESTSYAPIP